MLTPLLLAAAILGCNGDGAGEGELGVAVPLTASALKRMGVSVHVPGR